MTIPSDLVDYPANIASVLDLGERHFAWPMVGGGYYLWWHDCPQVPHISWGWFGRRDADTASGHVVESTDPLTVGGSLICAECGDHGWVRSGQWVPA